MTLEPDRKDFEKRAWLGLGGNLGDVAANMARALDLLAETGKARVIAVSSQYKTPPWGNTDQPWFINACAEISTMLTPESLLFEAMRIEAELMRVRMEHWGPRSMDIDILAYEGVEQQSQRLTIPHPRMLERAFVLVPLNEIAPDLVIRGRAISDWKTECDVSGIEHQADAAMWYPD